MSMLRRPFILYGGIALLAAGLVLGLVIRTRSALQQVRTNQRDKARMLTAAVTNAVRGVLRHGPDREERVRAVLDEMTREAHVITIAIYEERGASVLVSGKPLKRSLVKGSIEAVSITARGHELVVLAPFEVVRGRIGRAGRGRGWGSHRRGNGAGRRGTRGRDTLPAGRYSVAVVLDTSSAAEIRGHIVVEAVVLGTLLLLLAGVLMLLLRSSSRRAGLEKRVAMERQKRETLESLRLLSAGLAHEIKNPLGAIRGFAQLHLERASDRDTREQAALMLDELDRVVERLEEFLGFARKTDPQLEPVELGALARDVVMLLEPDASVAGIELVSKASDGAIVIQADPSQLKELLVNLVLNAIQACDQGDSVGVIVSRTHGEVTLTVEDTGRGIAPENLARVFEPYFSTRERGSGLGLPLSRRIADSHGASLGIVSEPGRGTRVTLRFDSKERRQAVQ